MHIPPLPRGLALDDPDVGPFREVRYSTADLFLHDLSPFGRIFGPHGPLGSHSWLFRGVKDSTYELVPSAFVDVGARRLFSTPDELWSGAATSGQLMPIVTSKTASPSTGSTNLQQFESERRVLREFFVEADKQGLPLPEDSQRLRRLLDEPAGHQWPPDDLLSLMALAQHHGCPTRLLDWSLNGLTAAWFAGSGALSFTPGSRPDYPAVGLSQPHDTLAVWALSQFEITFERFLLSDRRPRYDIRIVTAAHAANDNLHAQQGVFTLMQDRTATLDGQPDRRPLDHILSERYQLEGMMPGHPTLIRMLLPRSQARRLLTLLRRATISSAALFPGFGGVVDALWEARLSMSPEELNATRPSDAMLQSDPARPAPAQ